LIRDLYIVAAILILILTGLTIQDHFSIPSNYLMIFYTSNLRGQINPFSGEIDDRQMEKIGGIAFIRGLIDDTVNKYNINPKNVVILDTGDAIFGSAEASLTMGEVPFKLMQKAGYDAMAVGNMEFEFGMDILRKFATPEPISFPVENATESPSTLPIASKLPMLACNYRDLKAPIGNTFLPGIIIQKGETKIGVIGLGHSELVRNTRQDNIMQIEITDMKAAVQRTASALKSQGAELLILLSHHPSLDTIPNMEDLFPDIDIIIGDLIGPTSLNAPARPLICQTAPSRGAGIGMVKIPMLGSSWNLKKAYKTILTVDAEKVVPNSDLVSEIARIEGKVDSLLEDLVAQSGGEFKKSFNEECAIGDLIADSMIVAAKTSIAFQNSGGIKAGFSSGTVSLRDLYDVLPFENTIVKVDLFGWQVENLIEESLSERGSFLQASGINCIYCGKNPVGFRLIQINVNDEPLEFNKIYSVAVNDFMLSNPNSWPELSQATNVQALGLLRENLKAYMISQGTVFPNVQRRFMDVSENEETLKYQALSMELASLSSPVSHTDSYDSEYGRLLSDILRTETDSDFALVPCSLINNYNDPLTVITPAKIISDIPVNSGVKVVVIPGNVVQGIVESTLASEGLPICFSGFSIELKDGKLNRIFGWEGEFDRSKTYKVAIPSQFPASARGFFDISTIKTTLFSTDIRRMFINGLRRRAGKVELRRATF